MAGWGASKDLSSLEEEQAGKKDDDDEDESWQQSHSASLNGASENGKARAYAKQTCATIEILCSHDIGLMLTFEK